MIDWQRVRELQSEIGAENMREVIDLFMTEVESGLGRAAEAKSPTDVEEALHFLKGCALNIGFAGFAEICREWETAAAGGDVSGYAPDQLTQTYAQSREVFMAGMATELAA